MTAEEMVRGFQSELHQRDGPQIADSDDILYFLNKAQDNFLLDKFSGKRSSAEGFEQSQDLIDDLRVFYEKDCRTEAIYGLEEAQVLDVEVDTALLPLDYIHLVTPRAEVLVSDSITSKGEREDLSWKIGNATLDNTNYSKRVPESGETFKRKIVPARLTQSQSIYEELDDPFHTTAYNAPICDLNKDRLNVYTAPEFIVDAVVFNYIRQPTEIRLEDGEGGSSTSELPEALHQEIVERAAMLFLRNYPQSSNEQS